MFRYNSENDLTTQKNIFTDIFSVINKIYNMPDYMLLENIPNTIWNFYYISKNIDLKGKYFTYNDEYINLYIIKDMNGKSFKDTMLINNEIYIIIVIPYFDYYEQSLTNKERVKLINNIYKYIFSYLIKKMDPYRDSSLERMLKYAPSVLTIQSEYVNGCYDYEYICRLDHVFNDKEVINKILELDVKSLFIDGAVLGIIK